MTSPPDAPADAPAAASGSTPAGIGASIGAVTAWGLGNVLIAGVPMSGIAISFYRLMFGALLYLVVLYARGGRLSMASLRHGWEGGLSFGADIVTFFIALQLTTVANATTISALQPLVIMGFAAVMFGERIHARHIVSAVIATVGVAMVAFGAASDASGSLLGDLMAVAALFAWAWYFIASKKARRHLDTLEYMTVINVIAFLVVIPVALLSGDLLSSQGSLDPARLLAILAIVAVPGSGHILINWAHNHTTLVMSSLITLGMPVISTAAALVFLDQRVAAVQVAGIVAVIVALAAVIIGDGRSGSAGTDIAEATEPAP